MAEPPPEPDANPQAELQRLHSAMAEIGQIAHDFNNVLVIISGNLELLLEEEGMSEEGRDMVDDAWKAAKRGADLAQRLLTFSPRRRKPGGDGDGD